MKYFSFAFIVIISLSGCYKKSDLANSFDCKRVVHKNLSENSDFKKNFRIPLPNHWETKLYFDENKSEIFTADTIKQLSETYIVMMSFNYGTLNFDEQFYRNIDTVLQKNDLDQINAENITFKKKPAYWYLGKGVKNKFTYHQFNLMSKNSETTYFTTRVEIYGDGHIEERICESISILNKIEFLK